VAWPLAAVSLLIMPLSTPRRGRPTAGRAGGPDRSTYWRSPPR